MTVVDLSSKRLERERARSCPGCGPAQLCYPHRLEAVAVELRSAQRRIDEELLVPASDVEVMVARVLTVLDGITAECLPRPDRPAMGRG